MVLNDRNNLDCTPIAIIMFLICLSTYELLLPPGIKGLKRKKFISCLLFPPIIHDSVRLNNV